MFYTQIKSNLYLVMHKLSDPTKVIRSERVHIPWNVGTPPFSIEDGQITTHTIEEEEGNRFVMVTLPQKRKAYVYYLTNTVLDIPPLSKPTPLKLVKDNIYLHTVGATEAIIKGAYAASYLLLQQKKVTETLDVLYTLGDVALIDAVSDVLSEEDFNKVQRHIVQCITFPSRRLTQGRNTEYRSGDQAGEEI